MAPQKLSGWTGLITGASRGIGRSIALDLSADLSHLHLLGRDLTLLKQVAEQCQCETTLHTVDLAHRSQRRQWLADWGPEQSAPQQQVDLLINNAGIGLSGPFAHSDPAAFDPMLEINIHAVVDFTRAYLAPMLERKKGYVLNISSIAGEQACPYMAAYGATKSFVTLFSEAIAIECGKSAVGCGALLPGSTRTDFFNTGKISADKLAKSFQSPEQVARAARQMIEKSQSWKISGLQNWLTIQSQRLAPRFIIREVAKKMLGGLRDDGPPSAQSKKSCSA